jgi:class 3 adenylate cyclase
MSAGCGVVQLADAGGRRLVPQLLAEDHASVGVQPSGTVTFVFTDIEGSTALLDDLGAEAYKEALADHRRALREAFGAHSGYEVDEAGDGLFYAFASASNAVTAVAQAMGSLAGGPVRVRVGVHTGEPVLDPPKYVGPDVHKAARIMSAAHGGQVLISGATRELVAADVLDLGRHRLRDFAEHVSLYQLGSERFPPLRTISNTNLPVPLSSFVGARAGGAGRGLAGSGRGGAAGDARRSGWDGEDATGT